MRLPSYKEMLQIGGVLILGILFVGWASRAYADSMDVKYDGDQWYAVYQSTAVNTATQSAGAYSDIPFNAGVCELTRAASADVTMTLQKSMDGTAFANVSANHTYSVGDTNSSQFDFVNKGGRYWRINVPTALGANSVSAKCWLWRP